MTLPSTGPISMSQVRAELGRSSGPISLGEAAVRRLAGRPDGDTSAMAMSDLRGKSSYQYQGTMSVGLEPTKGQSRGYTGMFVDFGSFGSLNLTSISGVGDILALTQGVAANVGLLIRGNHSNFFNQLILDSNILNSESAVLSYNESMNATQWTWSLAPTYYIYEKLGQNVDVKIK